MSLRIVIWTLFGLLALGLVISAATLSSPASDHSAEHIHSDVDAGVKASGNESAHSHTHDRTPWGIWAGFVGIAATFAVGSGGFWLLSRRSHPSQR